MTRQEANLKIAEHITTVIEYFPDLRFGQILSALNIIKSLPSKDGNSPLWMNEFNTEPTAILKDIKKSPLGKIILGIK